jgi:FAD synthase
LNPIYIEQTAIQLLKPGVMEILQTKPYASAVFLHCFVNIGSRSDTGMDSKSLEEHIIDGYKSLQQRMKVEMVVLYRETLF